REQFCEGARGRGQIALVHDQFGLASEHVAQDDRRRRFAFVLVLLRHDRPAIRNPLRAVAIASPRGSPAAMAASMISASASRGLMRPVATISLNRQLAQ